MEAQHRWLAQGTGAVEVPRWLGPRQPATLQSWLGEQIDSSGNLKQPLPVPRSLFYRPLLTIVGEALDIGPQTLEREGTQQFAQGEREARPSITWLIKRYLDGHQGDGSQEMYGLPRHYDVFDTHLDTRTKKQAHQPKPLHYLTVSQRRDYAEEVRGVIRDLQDEDLKGKRERSLSAYRANERALRQLAAQDMVLFLRAKRRLAELQYSRGAPDSGWSLRTLEATLLNTPIHYALP
ncbi:MAG: hypothetical protein L0177_01010, partial [Chloroflexi bacterium]|nr:hypothetical protein [Chloroflexota bacterium]